MGRNTLISNAAKDTMLGLVQGFVKSDGSISVAGDTMDRLIEGDTQPPTVSHEQAVTTTPIYGGAAYRFEAASGYRVVERTLFDAATGELLQYFPYVTFYNAALTNYGRVDSGIVHKSMYVRLTLIKVSPAETNTNPEYDTPAGNVSPTEHVIGSFLRINPMYYERMASTLAGYANIRYRAKQLANIVWSPVAKMRFNTSSTGISNIMFLAGKKYMGVPYSECGIWDKWVGNTISFRQFYTSLQNNRSLIFTDNPHANTSGYGITYGNTSAVPLSALYYGAVCSSFLCYALGFHAMYSAAQFGTLGYTEVTVESDCSNIKPGDIMQSSTHVRLIVDVWKDADGTVSYVECLESTTPAVISRLWTPADFATFKGSYKVLRMQSTSNVEVDATPWIWQEPMDDVVAAPVVDTDICTFAGDYASFAKSDVIYLNVNRDHGRYTDVNIEMYDETNYEVVGTLSLASFAAAAEDADDIVDLPLTSLDLQCGKYRAKAIGTNNESGFTYFEILGGDITCMEVADGQNVRIRSIYGEPESAMIVNKASGYVRTISEFGNLDAIAKERGMYYMANRRTTATWFRLTVVGEYGRVGIDFEQVLKTNYLTTASGYNKGAETTGKYIKNDGTLGTASSFVVSKVMLAQAGTQYRYAFVRGGTTTTERVAFYNVPFADIDGMTQTEIDAMVPISIHEMLPISRDIGYCEMHDFVAPAGATCMRVSCLISHTNRSVIYLGQATE